MATILLNYRVGVVLKQNMHTHTISLWKLFKKIFCLTLWFVFSLNCD